MERTIRKMNCKRKLPGFSFSYKRRIKLKKCSTRIPLFFIFCPLSYFQFCYADLSSEQKQLDCDYGNSSSCDNGTVSNNEDTEVFSWMLAVCLGLVLVICVTYAIHQRRLQGKALCFKVRIYAHDSNEGDEMKFQRRYGCQTRKNPEGFEIEFTQPDGIDISTTSSKPIGMNGLNFYFEVMIAKKAQPGLCISIGVAASRGYSYSNLPGWKKDSIGFKSDDGKLYTGSPRGREYSTLFSVGDTIGCGFDGRKLFFTMNGQQLLEAACTDPNSPGHFMKDAAYMCIGTDGCVKCKVKVRPPFLYPGAGALLMPVGQLSPHSQMATLMQDINTMRTLRIAMATEDGPDSPSQGRSMHGMSQSKHPLPNYKPSSKPSFSCSSASEEGAEQVQGETDPKLEPAPPEPQQGSSLGDRRNSLLYSNTSSQEALPLAEPVSPEQPIVAYIPPRPLGPEQTPQQLDRPLFTVQATNPPEAQSPQVLYSTSGQSYATPGGEDRQQN